MSRIIPTPMATDRYLNIDYDRMRKYRLKRAKDALIEAGIDLLITWDAWDVRYISGSYVTIPTRWFEGNYAMLPVNDDPHVYNATSFESGTIREELPWLKGKAYPRSGTNKLTFGLEGIEPLVKQAIGVIEKCGLGKDAIIGLDGCTSQLLYQEAFAKYGYKVVDAKFPMFKARSIKNPDEIACIRMACDIADAAFADIKQAIRPGVRECELVGIGMNRLFALGCDETMEFVCASGPRTNPMHIDYTDRIIAPGDLVAVDINGASYNGYKTCYYRTFCCGKATEQQKDSFKIARDMLYDGMSGIKAGNTVADVCDKWPKDPGFWGVDNWGDAAGYALAHGIGLSLHEYPMFRPVQVLNGLRTPFEEGMVIAIETWYGPKGGDHGVRLEECVVVTKDGYELLTHWPIDELTECLF
ncbi:MAG: M24 family metallopeptidase [Lachnospiraceae bacterium]|jgi:Xaa-Pro aminopeptidase